MNLQKIFAQNNLKLLSSHFEGWGLGDNITCYLDNGVKIIGCLDLNKTHISCALVTYLYSKELDYCRKDNIKDINSIINHIMNIISIDNEEITSPVD